jgi:hypothetical protein
MVNEVDETIRAIKHDIEFHKLKLNQLHETGEYINDSDIPEPHKKLVLESIGFSMDYHNHKIIELVNYREEVMKKYGMIL